MKICKNCGAIQSDERFYCIECEDKLGAILSEKEKEKIEREIEKTGRRYLDKTSVIQVTVLQKLTGVLSLAGTLLIIILILIYKDNIGNILESLIALALFIFCSLEALLPKLVWNLGKLRYSFFTKSFQDTEPSDLYLSLRKVFIYISFFIAVIAAISIVINISESTVAF